jgi:hypothetical protein
MVSARAVVDGHLTTFALVELVTEERERREERRGRKRKRKGEERE